MRFARWMFVVAVAFGLSEALPASAGPGWEPALVPVTHVYVPKGFDSNDDTQVVVEGYLPNLCYKSIRHRVRVSGKSVIVEVYSYRQTQGACAEMIVPFLQPVSLGQIRAGAYVVTVNPQTPARRQARLNVNPALVNSQDDFIYANVEQIAGLGVPAPPDRWLELRGYTPSDCLVFDRVEFISNDSDTYSVLPIMRQIREHCPRKMVPFRIPFQVPAALAAKRILLHVRAMDGRSVNGIFANVYSNR